MRSQELVLISFSFVLLSVPALAQGPVTVWNLNGSQMELSANGTQREFRYRTVRPGLAEVGIHPGTVIFKGSRAGNEYSGTAFVYSKSCGALPYPSSGPVSPDERTVTLRGKAPTLLTADCEVAGYRDDVAVFELLPDNTPETQIVGEEKDYGNEGHLFSSGKDDYYLLSRAPKSDEGASGYLGQVRVVHHYEGGGYQILMKDYSARCKAADGVPFVTWTKAGNDSASITVRIDHPDTRPKADDKESYNLYWAACYESFQHFN